MRLQSSWLSPSPPQDLQRHQTSRTLHVTDDRAAHRDGTAGACIATQLLDGGATDPIQIVAACVGVTIADVIQVVETLTAAQPDSGTSPTTLQLRLAAVHTRALGLRTPR